MPAGANSRVGHILFLSYHLPMAEEPGAFRPWMEARLLSDAGFRVTVVTSGVHYMTGKDTRKKGGWCSEEMIQGIRVLKTWAPADHRRSLAKRIFNYVSYAFLGGLVSFLKVGKIDRVFAGTDPIFMMPVVFLISLLKRAPMVLDERDLYPETAIALGVISDGWITRAFFYIQQFFRRKAFGILAATPGIRSQLIGYGHPPSKVHLLYNADAYLDDGIGHGTAVIDLRRRTEKEFLVGYAGGLGRANHVFTLVRAAHDLNGALSLAFVIIGTGEMRTTYIDYCRRHALHNVFFFDAVPRREARRLLQQMDICVQPLPRDRHFSHTLTSKTFDYHGLGKPMIFCGQGDTVRLIAASGGGIAVEPEDDRALADAIRLLWQDTELRYKMGASARKWFKDHIDSAAACKIMKRAIDGHGFGY